MDDPPLPYEYRPLGHSEIRLVSIRSVSSPDSAFHLQLEHFQLHNAPPYIALSYVWGDPEDSVQYTLMIEALMYLGTCIRLCVISAMFRRSLRRISARHPDAKRSSICGLMLCALTKKTWMKVLTHS